MSRPHASIAAAALAPLALGLAAGPMSSRTHDTAAPTMSSSRSKVSCQAVLSACPDVGCAQEGSSDAITNELKRRVPNAGVARTLTFDDFKRLQDDEVSAFGDEKIEPTESDRTAKLHNLKLPGGRVSEGDLVQVMGYLVGRPHANNGESVNCKLTGTANNDFHLTLADDPGADETSGIVVEMTPQVRDTPARRTTWTLMRLVSVQTQQLQVLATGQLFYDNKHHVNDDPENVHAGDPKRFSLFEVHPVIQFYVCNLPTTCDPAQPSDWITLESYKGAKGTRTPPPA